jgi:formyl-CoA transferase
MGGQQTGAPNEGGNSESDLPRAERLIGVRVLEFGEFIAGPIVGRILGDFGAEVIKIEAPKHGDQIRGFGKKVGSSSLWWYLQGRNKKSITCDLHHPKGQELARRLAAKSAIVLENFRPGRMADWGLDYEILRSLNPRLVMVHISGFGQTGPYSGRAGFGSVAEAMGGVRYLTAEPGRPPVRAGFSLGDSVAGLYAAFGAVAALRHAERTGQGQEVDVAITEAVVSLLDAVIVEYGGLGAVRQPMGGRLGGAAPSNTYPCADGRLVVIGGNSESIFRRLMELIGHSELAEDPKFRTNADRIANVAELDELIGFWTRQHTSAEVVRELASSGVPGGLIYDAADIVNDPHYRARQAIVDIPLPETGQALPMQGVVPKFSATPGAICWAGPPLGAHNREIYHGVLGLNESEIEAHRKEGVI